MKKRNMSILSTLLILVMILQTIVAFPTPVHAESVTPVTPIFNPDYSKMVGRSDITYTGIITNGTQGMSVANGRFGGPVWQSNGSTLAMQLNHTDTFMFNDASAASKDHQNSGGGAVGRVSVGFGGTAFDTATVQHLSLYDGKLNISGAGVNVNVIANMDSNAIAIQITDSRATPKPITVDLPMLREANQIWGAHTAISTLTTEGGNKTVVLDQVIQEPCSTTAAAINDFYCHTDVAATVQGRDVSSVTNSTVGNRTSLRMNLPAQGGTFTIIIGGDSTMSKTVDVKANAIADATASPDYNSIYASSQKWWSDFWQKSYVYLPSHMDYEQRYNYYMYLAAISNRGSYPSKYNGGIWIAQEDRRDWGSFFWNWNQDSLYQPLMAADHLDLMDPLFKMRESNYKQYETAAKQMWGSEGIFIGETAGVLGWETLPESIAEAMKKYYTFKTPTRTQAFTDLTKQRNRFLPAWNWNVFGTSDNQASFVSHTMMATQETAEYYWQVYSYTKDIDWLRDHAYPFIKGAAELYRTYDGFRKEADGKYHFYNTNLHEHIWGGKDVIDDLSMAKGTFAAVVEASKLLGLDQDKLAQWEECRDNIADYPLRTDAGALWAGSTDSSWISKLATDKPAWAQGLTPAYFKRDLQGTESPIFKMLEKYDVLNLETRDQGLDKGNWDIALNTYLHSPGYVNQVQNQVIDRNGSSRFHVDAAKLGRADDMEMILNTQYGVFSTYGVYPNLLFDQLDYYSAEGYGTYATAIQEALNQSISPTTGADPVIRVFEAWPKAWDAKYKLLAKDGFTVSSSMESGNIQYVEIRSKLGEDCSIRNPWDSDVVLYRNGVKTETITAKKNDLLKFDTDKGENIVLVRKGTTPDTYRTSDLTKEIYTVANDTNKNIVYTGSWTTSSGGIQVNNYAKDVHSTQTDGDSAEFTFYGAGIDYITEMGPDMGEVEVHIDGKLQQTVNCYSEMSLYQQTAYVNVGLDYGRHKIKLVKKSGNRMVVDAFGCRREAGISVATIDDADLTALTYTNADGVTTQANGAWFAVTNRTGEGAYKSTAHICGNDASGGIGNSCEFKFYGTGVAYLTERNDDMGEVDVYIDGVYKETVTCYKTGGRDSQYAVYSGTGLPLGNHTLKLVKKSGKYMIVDAFKVTGLASNPGLTYIKINKQPKLSYDKGSALDLSEMVVNAAYSDGSMKKLAYNDAGLSVQLTSGESIANGNILTQTEHDGKTLTINYGGRVAKTEALKVRDESAPTWPEGSTVTAAAIGLNAATLNWTPATDNTSVTGYDIFNGAEKMASVAGSVTNYEAIGLVEGTEYTFAVQARDQDGNVSTNGPTVTFTTLVNNGEGDTKAPTWPEGRSTTSSAITTNSVTITWSSAQDDTAVTGYIVSYGTTQLAVDGNVTSLQVSGLAADTLYTFTIKAKDASSNWSEGLIATVTTLPEFVEPKDTTAPIWPEGKTLIASGISQNGLTLTWTAAQDDKVVTSYRIYKGTDIIATVTGSAISYDVTGLSSSTTYTFRIQAVDGANNSSSNGPSTTVTTLSSGGSTSTPVTPPVTTPETNTTPGKVKVAAPVVDTAKGTATITVDAAALTKAFTESKVVLVEIPKALGADSYIVSLPALNLASGDATKFIQVVTEIGTFTVPSNMLSTSEVNGAAEVELTIVNADTSNMDSATKAAVGEKPVIELNLKIDGTTKSWSNLDAQVKVSIPYTPTAAELADPEHITVWNIDGAGKAVAIPSARYSEGQVTFTTNDFGEYAVAFVDKTFTDIGKYSWAKNAIEVMSSKGVIGGTSETTYAPSNNITRADFMVLLVKALGLNAKTDDNYDDVAEGSYYYNAVAIAKKLGITTGVGDNKFDPKANISRQDMMVLAEKAMRIAGKELNSGSAADIANYKDSEKVSSYAQEAVSTFVKEGIIAGSGNKLNPKQTATRAETAVIIYKLYNK